MAYEERIQHPPCGARFSNVEAGEFGVMLVNRGGRDSRRLVSKISPHVTSVVVEGTILQLSTPRMINQLVSSLHLLNLGSSCVSREYIYSIYPLKIVYLAGSDAYKQQILLPLEFSLSQPSNQPTPLTSLTR